MNTHQEERIFIHDIANDLAIVLMLVEILSEEHPHLKETTSRITRTLEKINTTLQTRRAHLNTQPSSENQD